MLVITNVTKARAAYTHLSIRTKRFQHLPEGSQCDCRITKRSKYRAFQDVSCVLEKHLAAYRLVV